MKNHESLKNYIHHIIWRRWSIQAREFTVPQGILMRHGVSFRSMLKKELIYRARVCVCVCVLLKKRGVYLYTCAKAAVYKVHTKGQYLTGSMAVVFLADDLPSSKLPPSQAYPPSSHHGKLHQLAWAAAVILKISMKHGKLINHFCLYSWNMILLINHYLLIIELFTVTSK